ncbi:hypothetical protein [Streptomyces indicus]|uniref:hypothetical protein n=1 Tax=Streptomyces indicus TaxID=417292 RepID=UPI000B89371C|nr:hypothetical protein [Streptomyces indicus]
MELASADDALGLLRAAWSGVFALLCLGIAFNIRDVAFRIYQFTMYRGPFAPGFGFSPTLIRVVGGFLGAAVFVECAVSVAELLQ